MRVARTEATRPLRPAGDGADDRDVYVYEVSAANRWRAKDFAELAPEQIRALFPSGIGGQVAAPAPASLGTGPPTESGNTGT